MCISRHHSFKFLVAGEKEKFVFYDWAAECETVSILLEAIQAEPYTIGFVARKTFIGPVIVRTAMEFVGTGLGNDIDVAADEISV